MHVLGNQVPVKMGEKMFIKKPLRQTTKEFIVLIGQLKVAQRAGKFLLLDLKSNL